MVTAWVAAAAALLFLLVWSRRPDPGWLVVTALALSAAAGLGGRRPDRTLRRWLLAGLAVIAVALLAGIVAQDRLSRIESGWPAERAERSRRLSARLGREIGALADLGRIAAREAAAAADSATDLAPALEVLRERTGVDALMVFADTAGLIAWAGAHHGELPSAVRTGGHAAYFEERPLYSYLYFSTAVKAGGSHAVAAVLLETAAPRQGAARAISFAARTDVPALFRSGAASGEDVAWSLEVDGDTVVHARIDVPSQGEARAETGIGAARVVFALVCIAYLLLLVGWLRERDVWAGTPLGPAPLLLAAAGLVVAPLGPMLGEPGLFSRFQFLLPGPLPLPLGVIFAAGLPLTALLATRARRVRRERAGESALALAVAFAAVGAILVAVFQLLRFSAAPSLLRGGSTLWFGLQATAVLLLTPLAALLLPGPVLPVAGREPPARRSWLAFASALLLAAGLALAVHGRLETARSAVPAVAALWAVPYALLGLAFRDPRVGRSGPLRWLSAGFIAACAVLPQLWGAHTGARLDAASDDVESLGEQTPPILDFILEQFGAEAAARHAAGESGPQLVYRSWVASGLAREPYPVQVTLWSASGAMETELSLGGAAHSSAASRAAIWHHIEDTRHATSGDRGPRTGLLTGVPNVSRILVAPLDSLHVLSVVVEPRRSIQRAGILAPFLGGAADPGGDFSLVAARGSEPGPEGPRWDRVPEGWRGEALIQYPDGPYHAHLTIPVTGFWMRIARGALLVAFDLLLLALLWLAGHVAQGIRILPGQGMPWVHTFRARVTFALFGFFIVPTAAFGWIAYRGLSSIVTQAATTAASRAAQQASLEWEQAGGDLVELSQHAGADVLYYLGGELVNVSSPEALALGVYNAWMSPGTFRLFERGEESAGIEPSRIGDQEYVMAFHVLKPAGTLAVPVGVASGQTAQRQRDVAHLVLLAAVLGAMLSILLSIVVGRALAGPIGLLQRAAAAVGGGRLSVRLPEPKSDEFGQLFASFNRMVRQLRRARAREVRTARVLAWGEMARQIAHEIKNPLTPIRLAVQHLRRAWRDGRSDFGELLDENVEQVLTEIDRLNAIARAFSRYGAPAEQAGPLRPVDVAAVAREALTLYRAGETDVAYLDRLDASLPPVNARADEVREVLLNLLENARDAVGEEGRVVVDGRVVNGFVEIAVSDSGPGIAEDLLPRIFEPHFSTRSSGTGLGLAIVRRLVEGWGGTVDALSVPDEGTTLRVRIPVIEAAGEAALPRSAPAGAESPDTDAPDTDRARG